MRSYRGNIRGSGFCWRPLHCLQGPLNSPWADTEPVLCTDQRGREIKCAGPISSQPVGRPSVQWGCQTNSTGQQCTAWRHFLPVTRGSNPAGPPAFFRCRTAAILSPLQARTWRYWRLAQRDTLNGDVLICPPDDLIQSLMHQFTFSGFQGKTFSCWFNRALEKHFGLFV